MLLAKHIFIKERGGDLGQLMPVLTGQLSPSGQTLLKVSLHVILHAVDPVPVRVLLASEFVLAA